MKANIRANGTLEVIPENEMESYALSKWFDDYTAEEGSDGYKRAFLKIMNIEVTENKDEDGE